MWNEFMKGNNCITCREFQQPVLAKTLIRDSGEYDRTSESVQLTDLSRELPTILRRRLLQYSVVLSRDGYACYDFTKVSITKISRLVETLSFRSIFCAISIAIKKKGEKSWEESRRHLCNITIPFLFHSTHTLNLNDYPTQ